MSKPMNSKIQELYDAANTAYAIAYRGLPDEQKRCVPDLFANLIIRDCVKYLNEMQEHNKQFNGTLDLANGLSARYGLDSN